MLIPHDEKGRALSLKLPVRYVYGALLLAVFSMLVVGSSVVYSAYLSRRLTHYAKAVEMNREQQQIIAGFSEKTEQVNKAITELVQEDNRLRKLLGLKSWRSKVKLASVYKDTKYASKAEKVAQELEVVKQKVADREKSLAQLKKWVNKVRQQFASTPSQWPVYGRISSRYGYRVYPWRGFHTGIDISAKYGSPVRATADGVVSYAGWRQGYGKTVIIKHGYGKTTLFGHNSRYVVKAGQKVKKGQIICYVGNTGHSTGPHVHYEVRRAGRPVNPISYLNLNILSASKIWRK